MKSGRKILLDFFFYFVVYGNFLAVHHFFDSLAVFVLAGNLSGYFNGFEIVFLFYGQSNQSFCYFTDLFCSASVVTILPLCNNAVTWLLISAFLWLEVLPSFLYPAMSYFPPFVERRRMLLRSYCILRLISINSCNE